MKDFKRRSPKLRPGNSSLKSTAYKLTRSSVRALSKVVDVIVWVSMHEGGEVRVSIQGYGERINTIYLLRVALLVKFYLVL